MNGQRFLGLNTWSCTVQSHYILCLGYGWVQFSIVLVNIIVCLRSLFLFPLIHILLLRRLSVFHLYKISKYWGNICFSSKKLISLILATYRAIPIFIVTLFCCPAYFVTGVVRGWFRFSSMFMDLYVIMDYAIVCQGIWLPSLDIWLASSPR